MRIELRLPNLSNTRMLVRTYDPELDDIRSILSDVCRSVEHNGRFVMSGFGQDRWPVDVGTDLIVFLEQLPEVLRAVASGMPAELNLYEQGIERMITFSPVEDHYLASCVSHEEWQPNPAVEQVDRASLEQMLSEVEKEFMRLVHESYPSLAGHPWVQSWLEGADSH